jgi:hypothetical protein
MKAQPGNIGCRLKMGRRPVNPSLDLECEFYTPKAQIVWLRSTSILVPKPPAFEMGRDQPAVEQLN